MATETYINITDLQPVTEVANGDYLILETPAGTRIVDFKDFIIPNTNIVLTSTVESNTTAILSSAEEIVDLKNTLSNSLESVSSYVEETTKFNNDKIELFSLQINSLSSKFEQTGLTNSTPTFNNLIIKGVNGNLYSGSYTPTPIAGNSNVITTTLSAKQFQYLRLQNVVNISGLINMASNGANKTCVIKLDLPIASNMVTESNASGVITSVLSAGETGYVIADPTTDKIALAVKPSHISESLYAVNATYYIN